MAEMTKKTPFSMNEISKTPSFQRTNSEPPPPMGARDQKTVRGNDEGGLGSQMIRSAEGLVSAELGKQTGKGADQFGDVADALRQTSKSLENNMISPYVEKAADEIGRVSDFLRTADTKEIMKSVEDFARKEPLLFLGGAFALGIVGVRFLKSSSPDQASEAKSAAPTKGGTP